MVTDKFVQEQLEKLQYSETWQEKREVIRTLEMAEVCDPIIIQPLIVTAQKGTHRILRRTAVRLLGKIGDPKAVEPLIIVLLKTQTSDVRVAAAQALGQIGDIRAVGYLVKVLEDVNEETIVREGAAEALGKIRDGKSVKPLTKVMGDHNEDQGLCQKVMEALSKIATEEAISTLVTALGRGLDEKSSELLKDIGRPAVIPLIAALNGDNEGIMWKAVTILGEIGDKMAVEPLIALLLDKSKDEYGRGHYVPTALGKIRDANAVEPLIQLVKKHTADAISAIRLNSVLVEPIIILNSVTALGDIGDHKAVEPLIAILENTSSSKCHHLRLATIRALRKLKDTRAVEPLLGVLNNPKEYNARDEAASALVELDDDRVELSLLKYFKTELEARVKSNDPEHQQNEMLEVVVKLMARLIGKSRGV